ncbi:hypothetical protein GOP47_0016686 [Adiantum capillus-veneris]|uniref:Uncharacterized protein n=1 Tax=Adiantum capillus-veneris TaxID=13818 RepID=A0A9D4UJ51_ADICA|nr:hypothetical protein GOP47_0016686 [Adiantum capillus-veneris]
MSKTFDTINFIKKLSFVEASNSFLDLKFHEGFLSTSSEMQTVAEGNNSKAEMATTSYRNSKEFVEEQGFMDDVECCFSSKACVKCLVYIFVVMIVLGIIFAVIACSSNVSHGRCHF